MQLQQVNVGSKSLADYATIASRGLMEQLRALAEPLAGKRVLHLSATAFGGGVAEILYTLVPLMRDAGLETEWRVIFGQEEFFDVTKAIHNALQGAPRSLTEEEKGKTEAQKLVERVAAGQVVDQALERHARPGERGHRSSGVSPAPENRNARTGQSVPARGGAIRPGLCGSIPLSALVGPFPDGDQGARLQDFDEANAKREQEQPAVRRPDRLPGRLLSGGPDDQAAGAG